MDCIVESPPIPTSSGLLTKEGVHYVESARFNKIMEFLASFVLRCIIVTPDIFLFSLLSWLSSEFSKDSPVCGSFFCISALNPPQNHSIPSSFVAEVVTYCNHFHSGLINSDSEYAKTLRYHLIGEHSTHCLLVHNEFHVSNISLAAPSRISVPSLLFAVISVACLVPLIARMSTRLLQISCSKKCIACSVVSIRTLNMHMSR